MPIYSYKCAHCSSEQDRIFSVSEKKQAVECECGSYAKIKISSPARVWAPTRKSQ